MRTFTSITNTLAHRKKYIDWYCESIFRKKEIFGIAAQFVTSSFVIEFSIHSRNGKNEKGMTFINSLIVQWNVIWYNSPKWSVTQLWFWRFKSSFWKTHKLASIFSFSCLISIAFSPRDSCYMSTKGNGMPENHLHPTGSLSDSIFLH